MIKRQPQKKCIDFSRQYQTVTITAPRQSGKTTLAQECFPKMPYVSLEEPDKRRFAVDDPRGLISFEKIFGPEIEESFVIYSGEEKHIQKGITFLPWQELTFTETMGRCHE